MKKFEGEPMALPRTKVNKTENEKQTEAATVAADIKLHPRFKNVITKNLKQCKTYADLKMVELHYVVCWGYHKDEELKKFIEDEITTIENFKAFIEQENKSGANSYTYTLKVDLFTNEINPAKVTECDDLTKELQRDLEDEGQLTRPETLGEPAHVETVNAIAAAKKSYDAYPKDNDTRTKDIQYALKLDTLKFLKDHHHLGYTEQQVEDHFVAETIRGILSIMNPKEDNKHANELGVKKIENKYVFALSEHELCETMKYVKKNAISFGYDQDTFCHLTSLPKRVPEVKVELSNEKDRTLNSNLTKSNSDMKSDPIKMKASADNSQKHAHSLPTQYNNKRKSPRSKYGLFDTNKKLSHLPSPHSGGHRSQSPSSSGSDGVSPTGSLTSSPNSSTHSSPTGSRSSNNSSTESSPSGSRHRFFDQAFDRLRGEIKSGKATFRELAEFTFQYNDVYSEMRGRLKAQPPKANESKEQQENKGLTPNT